MSKINRISLILVFTFIFGVIAFFHESRLGQWIDNEVYEFIYSSESFITTTIMLGYTHIGEVWSMVVLSLLVICFLMLKRLKIEALFFTLTMILSGALNPLLKNVFDRERPTLLRLIDIGGFSFPSGHAMGSAAFFGAIAYIIKKSNLPLKGMMISLCALTVFFISASRVYLGVHFPTDVIAGMIGGIICVLLAQLFLPKLVDNDSQ